jgi:hypothetical protein
MLLRIRTRQLDRRLVELGARLFVAVALLTAIACNQSPTRPGSMSTSAASGSSQEVRLPGSDHGGGALTANLSGAEEAPGPGDPDGSGTAVFTLNHGQGEICFELTVMDIDPASAAHIHAGAVGVPGPVVVGLTPPTDGSSSGCVNVDQELLKAIMQAPSQYYVNVHNAAFQPGAIRGQLSR